MKKIVIALFFILFCFAATASAAITIAGQNFSTIVVIPLILIVVFIIIFGIVIAFDKHQEKKEMGTLKKEKKEEDKKFGIMGKIKEKIKAIEEKKLEKEPKKEVKKEKQAVVEEEYRSLADYLDDIGDLKKRFKKLNADSAFKELVALIRNFFSDYLGIDYAFTFDELERELKAKNKEVVFFSKNLSDMNYDAESISKSSVVRLLNEFDDVVKKTILKEEIGIEKREKKKGIFEKKPEIKKAKLKEEKKTEERKKEEYKDKEKKSTIIELIREGRRYLKRDINKANDIYEEVYVLYHKLPDNKKKELKKKILDFYNAIRLELKS